MPHITQRDRYRWGELWMGGTCLTMIWYMRMILPLMVSFCATQPALGALAHVPWIIGAPCVLIAQTGHLMRLGPSGRCSACEQ